MRTHYPCELYKKVQFKIPKSLLTMREGSLVWLFCLIAYGTFIGYLMPKPYLKKSNDTIQPVAKELRGSIPFPKVSV